MVKWGEREYIAFDNSKDEINVFTQRRKPYLRRQLAEFLITVRGHTMGFNIEGTIWLSMYLNIGLQFQAHSNISLEKQK